MGVERLDLKQRHLHLSKPVVFCVCARVCVSAFPSLVGISNSVQKKRAMPYQPSYIFSYPKSSLEYQAPHQASAARTEERDSSWCVNLTTAKRAGNCQMHSPSALQSSSKGKGQERK